MRQYLEASAMILVAMIMIYLALATYNLLKTNRKMTHDFHLERYKVNMEINVDENIIKFLDELIENTFNEYLVLNIECNENIKYIKTELETQISKDVSYQVLKKLSPVFMDKLSLIYNRDEIPNIVSTKVYIYTLNYVIEKNRPKE